MAHSATTMAGSVAVVTGGGSGIGAAACRIFGIRGVRVAVLERDPGEAEATCAAIRNEGGEAMPLVADVSSGTQMAAAFATVERIWGRLDMLVANAGINGVWAPVDEIAEEEWERVFDVNLKGTFLAVKYALPLLKRRGGSIVVISSVNGTRIFSNAGASAYATTKAGQLAFARMAALELAKHAIRVNTICPGAIETNIDASTQKRNVEKVREPAVFPDGGIPLTDGKAGSALQVAQVIWFLCSPLASHVTGAEVFVDGGESLLRG